MGVHKKSQTRSAQAGRCNYYAYHDSPGALTSLQSTFVVSVDLGRL